MSDIIPVYNVDGNGGGGFGNFGEGIWYVIILALLFGRGGFGGGFGGFGGGDCGCQTAVTNGFALNGLENGIRGIQQGICDGFYSIQSLLASCCCETQRSIDGLKFDFATGLCNIGNAINMQTRDIIDNQNANYRGIMDFLVTEKLSAKDAQIASLTNQLSQLNQNSVFRAALDASTAEIIRRTGHDYPQAAYWVQPPTPVQVPCGWSNNNGCGCGCNNGYYY